MEKHPTSADVKKRMHSMVSKLREHAFRITPQRLAVLRVLAASDGHPSVDRIYETVRQTFPTTSIATVAWDTARKTETAVQPEETEFNQPD